jgi:hypothetical protein
MAKTVQFKDMKDDDLVMYDWIEICGGEKEVHNDCVNIVRRAKQDPQTHNIRSIEHIPAADIAIYLDQCLEDENYHSLCGIHEAIYTALCDLTGNENHVFWVYLFEKGGLAESKYISSGDYTKFYVNWCMKHPDYEGVVIGPINREPAQEVAHLNERVGDSVNHPKHYNSHPSGVECIDIVRHMSFNIGNVFKYLWRCGLKDGEPSLKDMKKALWYLQDEINAEEARQANETVD